MKSKLWVMTSSINEAVKNDSKFAQEVKDCIIRYQSNDWGDISKDDKLKNDESLIVEDRILAAYETSKGKIWIITEWDRSVTTILFPSDY